MLLCAGQNSERIICRNLIKVSIYLFTRLNTTSVSYLFTHFNNGHRPADINVTMTVSTLMYICQDCMPYGCRGNKSKCPFHSINNTIYALPFLYLSILSIKNGPADSFINRYTTEPIIITLTQNAFVGTTHSYTIIYIIYYSCVDVLVNPLSSTTVYFIVYTFGHQFPNSFYSRLGVLFNVFTLLFLFLNFYDDRKKTYYLFNFVY